MATETCDGCGISVRIAGGIAGIWSTSHDPTGGMSLTLKDDTEVFLCFECLSRLPPEPTAADVTTLSGED